eukprot:377208_1
MIKSFYLLLLITFVFGNYSKQYLSDSATSQFVWVSVTEYWHWRYSNDLANNADKTYHHSPSWSQAQYHCQKRFGTNMSSSNALISMLHPSFKAYFGLRQEIFDTPNKDGSHWIRFGETQCPSNSTDNNGYRLCYKNWDQYEPNNSWESEHCAEIDSLGRLNDIICFAVPYSWIAGFGCDIPIDYYIDKNNSIICEKYIVSETVDVLDTNKSTYVNKSAETIQQNISPHDESNWHILSIGVVDLFFKDFIIIFVTLVCIAQFVTNIVMYKKCKSRIKLFDIEE